MNNNKVKNNLSGEKNNEINKLLRTTLSCSLLFVWRQPRQNFQEQFFPINFCRSSLICVETTWQIHHQPRPTFEQFAKYAKFAG